jgi:hypothetical protein
MHRPFFITESQMTWVKTLNGYEKLYFLGLGNLITKQFHCLIQWRNVISGAPRFKILEGPPSRSAKGTSWAPYMHEFSRGSRACSSGKVLNLHSLKCHFLDFGERFHRILMVRKRHQCNISEALANVFAELYRLNLGAPIWPIEVGGPRVLPVWAHSSYATGLILESLKRDVRLRVITCF